MSHDELIQTGVASAVTEAIPHVPGGDTPLVHRVHAYLYPYVQRAVEEAGTGENAQKQDRRIKPWQYVARFWQTVNGEPELIAETDPAIMNGTGEIPDLICNLAAELHEVSAHDLPAEVRVKALETLPQLRNNLGRQGSAVVRLQYAMDVDGEDTDFFLQLDVMRLNVE